MRFRAMPIVLVAVFAIVAGCGSSNKTATSAAITTPRTTSASTTSAAAPSFASTTNCQQLAGVGAKFAQAMSAGTRGGKFDLQTAVSAYQALASAAPAQIRPDVQLMAQAFSSFAATLSKVGYVPGKVPTPAQIAGVTTAAHVFSQPKLRAAGQRLTAWAHQNCG
jgi:hypothetical protein